MSAAAVSGPPSVVMVWQGRDAAGLSVGALRRSILQRGLVESSAMPGSTLSASLRCRLLLAAAPLVLSACSSSPTPSAPGAGSAPTASPTTPGTASGAASVAPRPPPMEAEGRPLFIDDQQVNAPLAPGAAWG